MRNRFRQKEPVARGRTAESPTSDALVSRLVRAIGHARTSIFFISRTFCRKRTTGRLAGFRREAGWLGVASAFSRAGTAQKKTQASLPGFEINQMRSSQRSIKVWLCENIFAVKFVKPNGIGSAVLRGDTEKTLL